MSQIAELRCKCGEVEGRVTNASPKTVNRVVCYCDDCQAFLHQIGRADLLDTLGGSDIVQVAPASLSFHRGIDRIVGVRLTPKGLYRWYTDCCKTPVGNTLGPAIPFVGIVAKVFDGGATSPDDVFGKPVGGHLGKFAIGSAPEASMKVNPRLLMRMLRMIAGWRFGGKTWPHPFFDRATRAPTRPVVTLSPADRAALRPHCGPRPTAPTGA